MKIFFTAAGVLFFWGSALAVEQPAYDLVKKYENFELRRYAPYIVAETVLTGDFDKVGDEAFQILFGYISGKNRKEAKISMTAPVSQSESMEPGEKISMTAPVVQTPEGQKEDTYTISFIMPSKYTLDTLPRPDDSRIRLRKIKSRLMAARTYSGTWSEKRYRKNEAALLKNLEAAGLTVIGEPIFARYNSPFTLWFMRRNEVLLEVKSEQLPQKGVPLE